MSEQNNEPGALLIADVDHYETLRRLLPQAVHALVNGEVVKFGPYAMTTDGILYQEEMLSWDDVSAATIRREDICIEQRGNVRPWHCSPAAQIPNVAVFMALVNPVFVRRERRV